MKPNRGRLTLVLAGMLLISAGFPAPDLAARSFSRRMVRSLKWAFSSPELTPTKVERILEKRVLRTRKQLPPIPNKQLEFWPAEELPIVSFTKWKTHRTLFNPYENIPFWDQLSSEAKRNYFIAANNRTLKTFIKLRDQAFTNTKRMAAVLWRNRVKTGDQPLAIADLTKIMLDRMPKNTDYLLLGEEHESPAVHSVLVRFLRQVRAQNPDRKIFLLTEFLPRGAMKRLKLQEMKELDPSYAHVLNTAQKMGMLVRGLEPRFVFFADAEVEVAHKDIVLEVDENIVPAAATPEAIRLRNRQWIADIQALRKHNPDALFIIWAGAEHLGYLTPLSISNHLPAEKTFLIDIYSQDLNNPEPCDVLDFAGQGKYPFFTQRLLTWDDPALRRAAGFDMRILLNQKDFPKGKVGKLLKELYPPQD